MSDQTIRILDGPPTATVIAMMALEDDGVAEMGRYYQDRRPECMSIPEGCDPNLDSMLPHNGGDIPHDVPAKVVFRPWSVGDPLIEKPAPPRQLADNENLCELAGRSCYASFGSKAGRKTNKDYLGHILDIGHQCYDIDTEVLTEQGWKIWPDVTMSDSLATLNQDTNCVEYQKPIALVREDYSGRMYRAKSGGVDLLVTPNHRMFVCTTTTREGRKRDSFSLIHAEDLGHRPHAYKKDGVWSCGDSEVQSDIAALLGFSVGDGHVPRIGFGVEFHLRKPRKIAWLRNRASGAGWELRESPDRDDYRLMVPEEWIELFRSTYDEERLRVVPQGILTSWKAGALSSLFEGLIESDGHRGRTGTTFSTTNIVLAGQVQQIALHIGFAATIGTPQTGDGNGWNAKPCYPVFIISRNLRPGMNTHRTQGKDRSWWVDDWSGEVFCAQVPNEVLYVRRNGIPVWSGNSVVYHAKITFFFGGVSRRVSHELIRTYVGADRSEEGVPSQESTRFTHHTGCFIQPPYINRLESEKQRDLERSAFEASCLASYTAYRKFVERRTVAYKAERGKEPRGMARKRIYEAASSYLHHSCETSFVWTTNPAALFKQFMERVDKHSDLEYRRFAAYMMQAAYVRMPNLFPAVVGERLQWCEDKGVFDL